jgi:hypothetical protein
MFGGGSRDLLQPARPSMTWISQRSACPSSDRVPEGSERTVATADQECVLVLSAALLRTGGSVTFDPEGATDVFCIGERSF